MDVRLFRSSEGDLVINSSGIFTKNFLRMNPQIEQCTKATIISIKITESLVPAAAITLLVPTGKVITVMDESVIVESIITL
mgnify:CR=1 FL=1